MVNWKLEKEAGMPEENPSWLEVSSQSCSENAVELSAKKPQYMNGAFCLAEDAKLYAEVTGNTRLVTLAFEAHKEVQSAAIQARVKEQWKPDPDFKPALTF
ncbi:MAG: hypothetical protein DHS20C02_01170 [Micavibrio sp.]|nr:MAG: hypothetical protein DHS20C02_01170 [Micavibrio sp.]